MNYATTTYDIYKEYPRASPVWVEAVQGVQDAVKRMAKVSANDPSSDYFLYCSETGRVLGRLRRCTKSHAGVFSNQPPPEKTR
jgi:hypothetical protein